MPKRKHKVPQAFMDELNEMWNRVNEWSPPSDNITGKWTHDNSRGAYETIGYILSRVKPEQPGEGPAEDGEENKQ